MDDWQAVLAVEGTPTGDGRLFDIGSIGWRELPLTLLYQPATDDGHDGSFAIGSITSIMRVSTGAGTSEIRGAGTFAESSDPAVLEAQRMIREGHVTGVSVDVGLDLFMLAPPEEGMSLVDEAGNPIADEEAGEDAWLQIENVVTLRVQAATIMAATVVATPAFAEGLIEPVASAVVAAITVPATAPAEWFDDPQLQGPTPLVVTPEGRVFGHLAEWGTCHIGMPGCFTPPRSATDYALFRLGEVDTSDGPVPVGQITLHTNHADLTPAMTPQRAREHYEHTGAAVADVAAGEDEFGIWVAGSLRPGVDPGLVAELRAAKLSGDWRGYRGNLELVGALAVNIPGFPVPRGVYASGEFADEQVALVAAGSLRASRGRHLAGRITHVRVGERIAATAAAGPSLDELALRVHGRDLAMLADRAGAVALEHLGRRVAFTTGPVGDD